MRLFPLLLVAASALAPLAALAQWTIQESHTTASLRGIHALGSGVAWASGTGGTVLRTTDDGTTWQTCPVPPDAEKLDFRGVQAFDANTAIVMSSGKGDLSRLYKTTDACQSWKLVFTNPDKDGFWDALQIDGQNPTTPVYTKITGVLIGDPVQGKFTIFVSSDTGSSWRRWGRSGLGYKAPCGEHKAEATKNEGLFAASNESLLLHSGPEPPSFLFVTGGKEGSRLIYSNYSDWDGPPCSTNFLADILDSTGHSPSAGAFAAAASGWQGWLPEKLVVMVGDYSKPDQASSTLLLTTKSTAHLPFTSYFNKPEPAQTQPHGYRSAVAYSPEHKAWITVGPNGTDLSTDDGRNWRALKPGKDDAPGADCDWNALSLPFVVGPKGRIGKLNPTALTGPSK